MMRNRLSRTTTAGLLAAGLTLACEGQVPAQSGPPAEHLALVGATVFDGTGANPIENATVVVNRGRIECVGGEGSCPTDGAEVRDVSGRWIIPGLVDAHVHFSQTGWVDGRPDALDLRDQYPYEQTEAWLRENTPVYLYRSYLCGGVTSVYDVGGYSWTWALQDASTDSRQGPAVRAAGPLLSTRDHWVNLPNDRQFIHTVDESQVRAQVRQHAEGGANAIKIWYIAGSGIDQEHASRLVHAIGDEARTVGLPLIVHATGLVQAKDAVAAGAQLLVHSVTDQPVDDAFLEAAKAAGTFYNPTLMVSDGYRQVRARAIDDERQMMACVDPITRAKVFSTELLPLDGPLPDTAAMRAQSLANLELAQRNLKQVHDAGIDVVMGTDAGNPLTLHGASAFMELEAMQAAGLSPAEVLVAATRNGARAMGLENAGTLEAGAVADLLVLREDPLADVSAVRSLEWVMRYGQLWEQAGLRYTP